MRPSEFSNVPRRSRPTPVPRILLAAAMYVVFAICVQFGPETYGKSMEDVTQPAATRAQAVAGPVTRPA